MRAASRDGLSVVQQRRPIRDLSGPDLSATSQSQFGALVMNYGKWQTIRELGRGGQGVVHLARDTSQVKLAEEVLPGIGNAVQFLAGAHTQVDRNLRASELAKNITKYLAKDAPQHCAALKVLHTHVRDDHKATERLRREVEVLQEGLHPHIIRILDSSLEKGWFATPYYPLGPLSENKPLFTGKPLEALEAFCSLVSAVVMLHVVGIVHRDIKPENIFVSGQDLVLGDFGLVHFDDNANTRVSDTYENVGSRDWMPTWAYGKRVDELRPSFDVFSLGKVLWAMISGKTLLPLWYHHEEQYDLTSLFPDDPDMFLINVFLDGCIQEREERVYPSAQEVLKQIDRLLGILNRGGQLLRREAPRFCQACGYGRYRLIADDKTQPTASGDFGLTPVGRVKWRIYRCATCGHIQMFQMQEDPEAWGEFLQ